HRGLGVGVLGLQVGDDVGVVAVAQPRVLVDDGLAVHGALGREPVGDGGGGPLARTAAPFPAWRQPRATPPASTCSTRSGGSTSIGCTTSSPGPGGRSRSTGPPTASGSSPGTPT